MGISERAMVLDAMMSWRTFSGVVDTDGSEDGWEWSCFGCGGVMVRGSGRVGSLSYQIFGAKPYVSTPPCLGSQTESWHSQIEY